MIQCMAKREVAKAKHEVFDELYESLDNKQGEKYLYHLDRQRYQTRKDWQQVRMIKCKGWKCTVTSEDCNLKKMGGVIRG